MLSYAGKKILIKSEVQAIPSYAMACFAFPRKFCDKLNSYISNFWWGRDPKGKGVHWASWQKISTSKLSGGMGFRDFKAFNMAMLAKQGWRLVLNRNSFWGCILKGLYFPTPLSSKRPKAGNLDGLGLVSSKEESFFKKE